MLRGRIRTDRFSRPAIGLLGLALFVRLLVPAGWMPAAGQGYAIILCTDLGAATAWIDEDGKVHKGNPAPTGGVDKHCAFAGFGASLTAPDPVGGALEFAPPTNLSAPTAIASVAIGRGLAAPPPPQTGPPSLNL